MKALIKRLLLRRGTTGGGGGVSWPAGFYVDSVSGSDSNAGTSGAVPWATLGKLTSAGAITTNVQIYLKRGSKWRERLAWTGVNGVKIGNYGSGALPCIDGSNIAPNASFSKTVGRTNVYEIAWTHTYGVGAYWSVWVDGVRLPWVADVATVDSTPGSFTPNASTASPMTVYVHAPGSTAVTSDGKLYEILTRHEGISCAPADTGTEIVGVWGRRCASGNGVFSIGMNSLIDGCLMEDGIKHLALQGRNSICRKSVFVGIENPLSRDTSGTMHVFYEAASGAATVGGTIEDCYFYNGTQYNLTTGAYTHTGGGANTFATFTCRRNFVKNLATSVGMANCLAMVVNDVAGERAQILLSGTTAGTLTADNILVINSAAINEFGALFGGFSTATVTEARAAVYRNNTTMFGATSFTVRNSSFKYTASIPRRLFGQTNSTVEDSIFDNCERVCDCGAGVVPTALNRNADANNTTKWKVNNIDLTGLAALQAAHPTLEVGSGEAASIGWVGDPYANDWTLSGGSIALSGGRNAGSRSTIALPNWTTLLAQWAQGYTGVNGDVAP